MKTESALVCEGLTKSFGGISVVDSVNFTIPSGKVVGLIGENGAGKSTWSSMVAGIHRPNSGRMLLDGVEYAPESPADALNNGVALIQQEIRMALNLSVAENIFLGRLPLRGGRVNRDEMNERSAEALKMLGVSIDPRQTVRGLSTAVQQTIEIAKAILREPRYVIFDEPSASLTATETDRVLHQISVLKDSGAGVVFISHRLDEIRQISNKIVCMRDGKVVKEWETGAVPNEELVQAMVGRDFTLAHKKPAVASERIVLEVKDLKREGVFKDISFSVREGEILGIAGLVGAGRTEVVRALAGADKADAGEILVDGSLVKINSPASAIKAGIFMVPEERKTQGLNLAQTSPINIASPWERVLRKKGIVTPRWLGNLAQESTKDFDIRGSLELPTLRLSGGNQQKVLLAKWLAGAPKILILDEPTRGVDVGAKMAIYEIIRQVAAKGVAVVVVSSELEEVLGLSHRVLVMSRGQQQAILDRGKATSQTVMNFAVGLSPESLK
ncbi:MAG: ribose import ATP-binding protein RbsA [Actinomycetota bacterium]|jgi:ribose transport system ATP-binding protein